MPSYGCTDLLHKHLYQTQGTPTFLNKHTNFLKQGEILTPSTHSGTEFHGQPFPLINTWSLLFKDWFSFIRFRCVTSHFMFTWIGLKVKTEVPELPFFLAESIFISALFPFVCLPSEWSSFGLLSLPPLACLVLFHHLTLHKAPLPSTTAWRQAEQN